MKSVFRPHLLPSIATLVMLILMCGLGVWQIQRLHWKESLLATIVQRIHQDAQPIASFRDADEANYHPVTASGVFQNDHVFYLLALSLSGEGGYHVLTPFKLDDGMVLMVDRGWVPYDHRDNFFKIEGRVHIAGIMRIPEHHLFMPANDAAKNNWYTIDLNEMGRAVGAPLLPYVLDAETMPNIIGYPVGDQTRVTLPNNHLGYAVTWFGLAFVLVVIYLVASFQKADED